MKGMKKGIKVLLAVCCLVAVGILGCKAHVRAQVAKATDVALDYVEKKYPFDVKCVGGEYSALDDTWPYYIRFETTDQEPFYFTVLVQHDFKISEERYSTSGEARLVADNYYHCKFAKEAETYIKNALGEDRALKDVFVYCNYSALYAFALPVEASETDSLDELLQKMDFNVVLHYDNIKDCRFETIGKSLQEHGVHARNVLIDTEDAETIPLPEEYFRYADRSL